MADILYRAAQQPQPLRIDQVQQTKFQADKKPPRRRPRGQRQQTKPRDPFVARVEELRAAGEKKAVERASAEFNITERTGYRRLKRQH